MPLSEHEQRLLSALEQQLVADDPKFATTMQGTRGRARTGSRMAVGVLGVVAGMAALVLAVAFSNSLGAGTFVVAVVAFVGMLAGAVYAFSPGSAGPQGVVRPDGSTRPRSALASGGNGSMMSRFEQRWARRRDEGRGGR